MRAPVILCSLFSCLLTSGCVHGQGGAVPGPVTVEDWGKTPDGEAVHLYTLTNAHGLRARVATWGATLISLETPDRDGHLADIVLGFDSLEGYLAGSPYFGSTVGRYANRIAKGKFTLDGVEYALATNNPPNHLHGGVKGFDKRVWTAEILNLPGAAAVKFSYVSADGEEGYPGTLRCSVTYALTDANELALAYEATTDKPTVVNLTHHSYFNLAGQGNGDVLGHVLTLHAARYTPPDATLIPTGELKPVAGTPLDFTAPHTIGERIAQVEGGYDHNYVLDGGGEFALAARAYDPVSGRVMELFTDEPGMQFYTGNFLDGSLRGKSGKVYEKHFGFCLEAQHFPDSPNQPAFPSTVLRPGETYMQKTVHRFSVAK